MLRKMIHVLARVDRFAVAVFQVEPVYRIC